MKRTPITRKTELRRKTPLAPKKPMRRGLPPKKARQAGIFAVKRLKALPKRVWRHWKKKATPEEQAHLNAVGKMPCWACVMDGITPRPTNLHHIRAGYGTSQRASHWEVIPLCEGHHQGLVDATLLAFHKAERTWERRFGFQVIILVAVWARLGKNIEDLPAIRGGEPPWWARFKRGGYEDHLTDEARRVLVMPQGETA